MRTLVPALFCLAPALQAAPLPAERQATSSLPLNAPIHRVRLHPDEAWVTRSGTVRIPAAGTYRILLVGLPEGLRVEDVRVSAKGPAGSRLGDVTVGSEPRSVSETPEYLDLKAQRARLWVRLDTLESERESLVQELAFLKGLQAVHDQELSSRLALGVLSPGSVVELGKGIQERTAQALGRERALRRELETVKEELKGAEAELQRRASERVASPAKAALEILCSQAGEVLVEFTYRTASARWEPAYEARLAGDGRSLELVLFASVRNQGREAWADVELEVTNARSARNVMASRLDGPQWVRFSEDAPYGGGPRYGSATVEVVATTTGGSGVDFRPPAQPSSLVDFAPARAPRLEDGAGLASTWSLEGRKEVPADGDVHRFRVTSQEVKPDLAFLATPRQDPTVYRIARFAVPKDLPLFPGSPVVHFAGSQRVGQGMLELPAPGRPFQLGFGPVPGVRVALRRVEAHKDTVGAFSKETQWTVKDRIELTNDLAEPVSIDIQDAILKSEQDRVRISLLPDSTPALEEQIPGVRSWRVALAPGATGSLQLGTQIRVPMGGWVQGLGAMNLPR